MKRKTLEDKDKMEDSPKETMNGGGFSMANISLAILTLIILVVVFHDDIVLELHRIFCEICSSR